MHQNKNGEFVSELRNGEIYNTKEIAGYLGITVEAVRKHIADGELEAVKRDGLWYAEKSEIVKLEMTLNTNISTEE